MPEITFLPSGTKILASDSVSIRDAALEAGIEVYSPCSGYGICGKCLVRIASGSVSGEVDPDGWCLSCKTFPLTDCAVEIPTLSQVSGLQTVNRGLSREFAVGPVSVLTDGAAGVAIDLGTTSIVALLVDLATGDILASASELNQQSKFGDDVVSRIGFSQTPRGLEILHTTVISQINSLIANLSDASGSPRNKITGITVAGNATMLHLLLGESPASLGQAPYEPVFKTHDPVPFSELGINGHPDGFLRILPNIAGFVGGDTVAGILATGMHQSDDLRLFIDIGTNGEVVIGNKNKLIATSAAAGPAFEGGRIEKGMRAEPGAIDHVTIAGDEMEISTIGGLKPVGICGTGLLEAAASMLDYGLIRTDGHFIAGDELAGIPAGIAGRFEGDAGKRKFYLHRDHDSAVWLTGRDISELQLAKAAIRSAVELLVVEWGCSFPDISEIHIAGAFCYHLKPENLVRIGLLPDIDVSTIRLVGNTSLEGAMMTLLSAEESIEAARVASDVAFLELAGNSEFEVLFLDHLLFP